MPVWKLTPFFIRIKQEYFSSHTVNPAAQKPKQDRSNFKHFWKRLGFMLFTRNAMMTILNSNFLRWIPGTSIAGLCAAPPWWRDPCSEEPLLCTLTKCSLYRYGMLLPFFFLFNVTIILLNFFTCFKSWSWVWWQKFLEKP